MTTEKAIVTTEKQMTREQIDLIRHTVAVGATDNELKLFLYQASKRGLDPLARQIHFIKRKRYNSDTEKYEEVGTIQTGIDGFRVIAGRTGKLAGIRRGSIRDDKGNLVGAWAEIYRTDWQYPAREEVSLSEYCQKRKDGSPQGLWATMPETMLKKVAETAALRMAFPEDLSGIYSHDEMQQADVLPEGRIGELVKPVKLDIAQAEKDINPSAEGWPDGKPEPSSDAPQSSPSPVEVKSSPALPEVKKEEQKLGFDPAELTTLLADLKWKDATVKSYLKNQFKVANEGTIIEVVARLTKEQREKFFKELSDRKQMA